MTTIQQSVEVAVPAPTAYERWTDFEAFPRFVPAVDEVRRLDGDRLRCRARLAGSVLELEATITEDVPGRRLAWACEEVAPHTGDVTFEPLGEDAARVTLRLAGELQGAAQTAYELGLVDRAIADTLGRFKELVEAPDPAPPLGRTLPQPPR